MLTLNDGRNELWQWDTGRKLTVDADCSQVHFSNKVFGRSVDVDVVDGIAIIPDILLQTDKELMAWAFVGTAENGYTKISKVFKVNKRNKPADYVFTEPDQTTLGEILNRIEDLENRPSADISKEDIQDAVNEYLDNNPVSLDETDPTVPDWAKEPIKPTYTAKEVGAMPAGTPIPEPYVLPAATTDTLGGVKPVAKGADMTQEVGVDELGGLWTAPGVGGSGGGCGTWEHICDITTTEEISSVEVTQNADGVLLSDLKYNELWVLAKMVGVSTNTGNWWKAVATTDIGRFANSAQSSNLKTQAFASFYIFIRGSKQYYTDGENGAPYTIYGGSDMWISHFLDYYNSDHFVSLTLQGTTLTGDKLGIDTEIRVLGRRA